MKAVTLLVVTATLITACERRIGYFAGADNVRLYYHADGTGRSTVVVLHGIGSGSGYLAPDLVPLTRERVLLFYDQRGFGRSDLIKDPDSLRLEKHVSDLEALRQHFGLERMTLLGHSWGGIVAGAYAVAHPDRVERMLLVEPAVPASSFLTGVTQRDRALKERIGPAAGARADNLPDAIAVAPDPVAMCKEFFQDLGSPVFFRTVAAASRSRGEFCTPADALRNIATVAKFSYGAAINPSWDLRPHLRAVRAPTLVVYGEESVLGIEPMEGWATALPNARLFGIPDAQHYPHVDRPELFFPAAETFLSGTWPDAARDPHR